MHGPLQGFRILDLTNVLAGPFCCHQLVHMGAEVIKVEQTERGDLARQLGGDPTLNQQKMGVSFLAQNAGKKSVTVNLKNPQGKAAFKKLVANADVVVENFRPGVMKRLGLDYETLKKINPNLVFCAISGFGQTGPWVNRPAYDQIIQGVAGVMSITGTPEMGPLRVGYPVADTIGGLTAAFAIVSALHSKPRGTFIDVSMLESVLATMGWVVSNYLIADTPPKAHGNVNPTSAPSGLFATADGPINIAANKQEQWILLTNHLGLGHLQTQPEFATRENRKKNRRQLTKVLETILKARPAEKWVEELNTIGVPAGAVLDVADILNMGHIRDHGFLKTYENVAGIGRDIQVVTTGFKLDGKAPYVAAPPPQLGQDNDEIWQKIGYDFSQLDRLKSSGAI